MAKVFLGLGSNLGSRRDNIKRAIDLLEKNRVTIQKISSIIETEPVDAPPQDKFLNAVIEVQTELPPHDLLTLTQSVEQELGRIKTIPNGPRVIDIDILTYDRLKVNTPELTIPHPRMHKRDFVLAPLKEIAPEIVNELKHEDHPIH